MTRAVLASLVLALPAAARDDAANAVAAQKAKATEALKRIAPDGSPTAAETADLLLVWPAPPANPRVTAAAQKAFGVAKAAVRFEPDDTLWPGKLTVYVLASPAQYAAFVRTVEGRRADKGGWYALNTRADAPYVVVSPGRGEKPTEAELAADVGTLVGAALITRKAGATPADPLPEWLALGFGRAMNAQAEGGTRLAAFRAKAKAAAVGGKGRPGGVRLADVWAGPASKDTEFAAASLAEFLATGPQADKLPAFLGGFKPGENDEPGSVARAIEAAGWKPEALEAAWKRWAAAGR